MSENKLLIERFLKSRKSFDKHSKTKYIWFDQPYHLYMQHEQATAYLEMIAKDNFSISLHQPIVDLVTKYADLIINKKSNFVEFYDLGPGLPTKTIPLLNELKRQQIPFDYFPVDISESFLEVTKEEVKKIDIESKNIHCLFEELPNILQVKTGNETTRIFQIGLTFNNYRPNSILKLLKKMMMQNDFSLIITEFYDKKKLESILTPYKDTYAEKFNWLVLELLNLNKDDFVYETNFKNQRIEMGFRPKKNISFYNLDLTTDHIIITAISYRYSEYSLTRNIQTHFKHFEMLQEEQLAIYILKG